MVEDTCLEPTLVLNQKRDESMDTVGSTDDHTQGVYWCFMLYDFLYI